MQAHARHIAEKLKESEMPDEVSKTKDTLAVTKHQGMKEHSCCA